MAVSGAGSPAQRWHLLPVWVVLLLSLATTGFVWRMAERHVEAHERQEFQARTLELRLRLTARIDAYTQILRGGVGLFKASDEVTRQDWRNFVASLELEKTYPALSAVAFARHVGTPELAQLTTQLRASGVPDFAMRPAGEREAYVVNVFTEPYLGGNVRALGFDMWQEPMRRRAMEDALRRNAPAITEKLTLKIDEQQNPVPAFIMYLPVTDVADDPLYGFVLSPFRMPDLVADLHTPATRDIQLAVYDGTALTPESLYHREGSGSSDARFTRRETIEIGGRTWTLEYSTAPGFGSDMPQHDNPRIVAAAGLLISILLTGLLWSAVTLRQRAERRAEEMTRELRESETRFRELFHQAPLGVWLLDHEGHTLDCNAAMCRHAGATREAMIGFDMRRDAEDRSLDQALKAAIGGRAVVFETPYTSTIGKRSGIFRIHLTPIHLSNRPDDRNLVLGFVEDITERRGAEQRHGRIIEAAMDGFVLVDQDGMLRQCNAALCRMTGYTQEELVGLRIGDLDVVERPDETRRHIDLIVAQGQDRFESRWRRKDDSVFEVEVTVTYLSITGELAGFIRDITLEKQHARELDRIAHYDSLTGVPNRNLLADRMAQSVARTRREENLMGVCYLDLDGFKPINDRYGHETGDKLLVEIAERLKACLRGSDTVARMGGDEFVLLLLGIERTEECEAALRRILEAMARPVVIGEHEMAVSASLGVTLFPHDDSDMDTLLRHADQSMYLAKQSGKNRFHIFDPERDRIARDRAERLARIEQGIIGHEFILYYQPQVDMRAGRVLGVEALVRWQHPERGILPPAEFLAVIEDTDLIVALGERILESALAQVVAWRGAGLPLRVGVNIAARHLQRADFVERLRGHLAAHPEADPAWLELEVVESAALDDINHVSRAIRACKDLGIGFALDDFGTGYSSLTYLKALPAQLLKIDQTFVRDMLTDSEDCAIVEGVIGLARVFHRDVIAEGVETVEHGCRLLELGCERAQGYGIARPMPATAVADWARAWVPDPRWQTSGRDADRLVG